jgi:hypothetical protein
MFPVECCNGEAKMNSRSADNQILDRDRYASGCLLTLNTSGELRNRQRYRMHDHVANELFGKGAAPGTIGAGLCPINSVSQFNDTNYRECAFHIAVSGANTLDEFPDCLSPPLACNKARWNRGSVPYRGVARLTITDDLLKIGGELRIHHRLIAHPPAREPPPAQSIPTRAVHAARRLHVTPPRAMIPSRSRSPRRRVRGPAALRNYGRLRLPECGRLT